MKSRKKAKKAKMFLRAIAQCMASSQQSLQSVSSVSNMAAIMWAQETEAIQRVVVLSVEGLATTQLRKQKIKKKVKKVEKRDDAKKKQKDADVDSEDTCLDDSMNHPLHIRREDLAKLDEIREGNAMENEDVRVIKRTETEEQKGKETEDHKVDLSSESTDYDPFAPLEEHRSMHRSPSEEEKDETAIG